jgi:hypothetical protein
MNEPSAHYIVIQRTYELGIVVQERIILTRYSESSACAAASVWAEVLGDINVNLSYSVWKVIDGEKRIFCSEFFTK